MSLHLHIIRLWLLIGMFSVGASFRQEYLSKRFYWLFVAVLLLAGPLTLLLAFLPRDTVQAWAQRVRERME